MAFEGGRTPWNKGKTKETDLRISNYAKKLKGHPIWNTGRTRFKKGHVPWFKDLPKEMHPTFGKQCSEETKENISLAREGQHNSLKTEFTRGHSGYNYWRNKHHSEETKRKISKSLKEALLKSEIRYSRGRERHQTLVKKTADCLSVNGNKIEIEKSIPIGESYRVIDVLVNGKICYEIGDCRKSKIQALEASGYSVIHLPYSSFEGGIFPCV